MKRIQVLLVDDNQIFLDSIQRFLASVKNVQVVGCAASGEEAIILAEKLNPELVLMDLAMPAMNGLQATRILKAKGHAPRIVVLTIHDSLEYQRAAKSVGADGFIAKSEFGEKLQPLIESLFDLREKGGLC